MPINRMPDEQDDYKPFKRSMEVLITLTPPKRITVNQKGQQMLNRWIEGNPLWTSAWRSIPISCLHDQFSPYVGHNV
jgi:hypothetical protein